LEICAVGDLQEICVTKMRLKTLFQAKYASRPRGARRG
jgi:hypothetical protein